jgi:FkbM family methyltransferase
MITPSSVFDYLIIKSFQIGMPGIGEGLIYWFKSSHRQHLIHYKTREDVALLLNPHNYIDRIILSGHVHDRDVLDALKKTLQDSDVFWDIGANIGYISLSVLKMNPTCQVVAFEPSPFSVAQLFINNELNGNKITIIPFALSSQDEVHEFSLKINRNSGQSTLFPQAKFNYDRSICIQTKIADQLVRDGLIPSPSVVKIDVEGAEYMVLSGMKQTLADVKLRAIIFEGPSDCHSNILELLAAYQFNQIVPLNNNAQTDFLALRF